MSSKGQRIRFILFMLWCPFATSYTVRAQSDMLSLKLPEAEARFTARNLSLLASQFQLEESQAYQLQARLWDNPSLYFEQSAYNRHTREYLPAKGPNGQNIVQVQQLFLLAGKRSKRVRLARIGTERAEQELADLLRELRYELRANFIGLYYLQQSAQLYDSEIASLRHTVELYQQQYGRGNVPLKDLTRLKAFLFTLENERRGMVNQMQAHQSDLRVLMGDSAQVYFRPQLEQQIVDNLRFSSLTLPTLLETSLTSRPDLKATETTVRYEKQNLSYQKALAVPDLKLGGVYDRNGSYISNYYGVSVGIDLPLFNRNQGNIKAANARWKGSVQQVNHHRLQVQQEVTTAYQNSIAADSLFHRYDRRSLAEFDQLMEGMLRSYEKKNVTLLEFLDFYESYKNQILQFNQLQIDRLRSLEELHLATGKTWFTY